jgi:hypothetical protein
MRYYIGIDPAGSYTVQRGVRIDDTGEPLLLVDEGEIVRLRINMADWLESGETISSSTSTATNCTVSRATATPNVDLTISLVTSYAYGTATVLITSSAGDVWRGVIRIRRRNRYTDEQTYRDYR